MKKKLISILLSAMLIAALAACNVKVEPNGPAIDIPSVSEDREVNQLSLLKTDKKFTQEQMVSRIKAEYLKENKGYKSDDKVSVILSLGSDALIDAYLDAEGKSYDSVADFASSKQGKTVSARIKAEQDSLTAYLIENKLISKVIYNYSTVMNGVAVETNYGNLVKIEEHALVSEAILSETYNRPQAEKSADDVSHIRNDVNIDPTTGIYNNIFDNDDAAVRYTGDGTSVAVLDSGFDMSHSVFQNSNIQAEERLLITEADVNGLITKKNDDGSFFMNASQTTEGLKLSDVYRNKKIPYYYDYADKDPDVFPYDSEHGTHVAGIIGGYDSVIKGVAVNTQMVLMKVFPDLSDGGRTEDILAAVEDAVKLGVDAINMSLGSSCGFVRERDEVAINNCYDKVEAAGISLITAASNSYSSSFSGAQGDTNFVTNPDSGTVGSPSTYNAALSVASISGTLSNYVVANGDYPFFYIESNYLTGNPKVFIDEIYQRLGKDKSETLELEYAAVPGVGKAANYIGLDVEGKIALVRRGDTTFEEKAKIAEKNGAIGCIIYNNIDGNIIMSIGKEPTSTPAPEDIFPIISISKDDGEELASRTYGTLTVKASSQAGPFMSDFSSWGPTPSLELKPEITAHGGNIKSAIPGGGYDEQSGTSMATPNLCGVVLVLRQYIKDTLHVEDAKEITTIANQLLMSTATIALNEEGNPYSPRKQGAGLASLDNAVNTRAIITVDGKDRPKIELFDDPDREGVYEMHFNVQNLYEGSISYDVDLVGMTESVSTSDDKHVAETPHVLSKNYTLKIEEGTGTLNGNTVTVEGKSTAKLTLTYTLTAEDKEYIEALFPYGMYVEGFVKLINKEEGGVNLNAPFLAFYGDWTEAPMFDKTYYEVETEAHDAAIDFEDKLKADYYATTPYGSYYYNYIIPLGTYLYDMDTTVYEAIPASEEHAAISNVMGAIDGISSVYAGLLRNAATMDYVLTDTVTGDEVWSLTEYNARKAYSNGAQAIPYYNFLNVRSTQFGESGLINNHTYNMTLTARMDYERDGAVADGIDTNARNTFSFNFTMDNESPVIKDAFYEKEYDRTLKKDRYYVTLTVYDNHYAMAVTPIIFTSSSSYTTLGDAIPLYGEKGKDLKVRFEITDQLKDIGTDALLTSGLGFSVEDYALNTNLYLCQLPGTNPDAGDTVGVGFRFTTDGTIDGGKIMPTVTVGEVIDLVQYLYTDDPSVDEDKTYLKHLIWKSGNESIARVEEGQLVALKKGSVTITVTENGNGRTASMIVKVVPKESAADVEPTSIAPMSVSKARGNITDNYQDEKIKELRFDYFDTLFAYSRAAQTSEIGQTGNRIYISSLSGGQISLYPGEKIKLSYDFAPWYAKDNYTFEYKLVGGDKEKDVVIEEDGTMTALKEGTATVQLVATDKVTGKVSNIQASVKINVKSEFVIENRMLVAYKGMGDKDGKVVIPDDEGILYIGSYAFCLYDTDISIEVDEDDYDANKIPAANVSIKHVVVPDGVEEIQKYAFYNCAKLEKVELPASVKFIREYAFAKDVKLQEVTNLDKPYSIGRYAFYGCESLTSAKTTRAYAIGERAFSDCTSLTEIDIIALRNAGKWAFSGCSSLTEVAFGEDTKLAYAMFEETGLVEIELYESLEVPEFCFFLCKDLKKVTFKSDLVSVNMRAFRECESLEEIIFEGSVGTIGVEAFYGSKALSSVTLPDCDVAISHMSFAACPALSKIEFKANTKITSMSGSAFFAESGVNRDTGEQLTLEERSTNVTEIVIDPANAHYALDGSFVVDKANPARIILAMSGAVYGEGGVYTLPEGYTEIGEGAFSGANITKLIITGDLDIGAYAFAVSETLTDVVLPSDRTVTVGNHAFNSAKSLVRINLENVDTVGDYAFSRTALNAEDTVIKTKDGSTYGEGAFYLSKIVKAELGMNSSYGVGAFMECTFLEQIIIADRQAGDEGVTFSENAFAYDSSLRRVSFKGVSDTIPDYAFAKCSSLLAADIGQVKHIGDYAFADCSSLASITLDSVEHIGQYAFVSLGYTTEDTSTAPTFTEVNMPNLKYLGNGAFWGCIYLTEVDLSECTELTMDTPDENPSDEVYYTQGEYVFAQCARLEKVVLPESLKRIGQFAFTGCVSLNSINLNNVEYIDGYAFRSCASLTQVNVPVLKEIGEAGFAQSGLFGMIVASSLEKLGPYAFMESKINTLSAPELKIIGEGAFSDTLLTSFTFSDKLEEIEMMAFIDCKNLSLFNAPNADGKINDYAYIKDGALYTLDGGVPTLKSLPAALELEDDTLVVDEGTVRIEIYGGNQNESVKHIVLPSTLKAVGSYAFMGYKALESVEFKTVTAPVLESIYTSDAVLTEDDPGYELLHSYIDLFGWELCYFNFINLVGKQEPIEMKLPSNTDVEGYDTIVFKAYFGDVEDATRTAYVAKEKNLVRFIELAEQIAAKNGKLSLSDETLISNAVVAYNGLTQKGTDFGMSDGDWDQLVTSVLSARDAYTRLAKINELRVERVDKSVIALQNDIFDLTDDASQELLDSIAERLSAVSEADKNKMDLSKYNALTAPEEPDEPIDPNPGDSNSSSSSSSSSSSDSSSASSGEGEEGNDLLWLWITLGVVGGLAVIGAGAYVFFIKRRSK